MLLYYYVKNVCLKYLYMFLYVTTEKKEESNSIYRILKEKEETFKTRKS